MPVEHRSRATLTKFCLLGFYLQPEQKYQRTAYYRVNIAWNVPNLFK